MISAKWKRLDFSNRSEATKRSDEMKIKPGNKQGDGKSRPIYEFVGKESSGDLLFRIAGRVIN